MKYETTYNKKKYIAFTIFSILCFLISFWDGGILFLICTIVLSYLALKNSKRENSQPLPLFIFYGGCFFTLSLFLKYNTELSSAEAFFVSGLISLVPLIILYKSNKKYVSINLNSDYMYDNSAKTTSIIYGVFAEESLKKEIDDNEELFIIITMLFCICLINLKWKYITNGERMTEELTLYSNKHNYNFIFNLQNKIMCDLKTIYIDCIEIEKDEINIIDNGTEEYLKYVDCYLSYIKKHILKKSKLVIKKYEKLKYNVYLQFYSISNKQ